MIVKDFFLSWGMLFFGVLLNVFGIYLVKMKINTLGNVQLDSIAAVINYFFTLIRIPLVIIGGVAVLIAPLSYAIALSRMQLSVAYPVSVALNCLILIPLTVIFLGEGFNLNKAIGIVLILLSLYLLYK